MQNILKINLDTFFKLLIEILPKRILVFFKFNEVLLSLFLYYPNFKKILEKSCKKN